MARTIPLIRAAVLFPMIRWMRENGQDAPERLAMVGLDRLHEGVRERPVPLLMAFDLFRMLAAHEGPDACARMVSAHMLEELGVMGGLIRGAASPREALIRAVTFLPDYSTHETVVLRPIPGGLRVTAGWSLLLDDELMHLTQQFTAALVVGICLGTQQEGAVPRLVKIRPHPSAGIDHLRPFFGKALVESTEATVSIDLDDRILDAPLEFGAPDGIDMPPPDWVMPQGDGSFATSVSLALNALSTDMPVRIENVAALAGISKRSFQRLLTNEGTSFRSLIDGARRERTLKALQSDHETRCLTTADFGFSDPSSLARAVRRWTGVSPKRLRRVAALKDGPQRTGRV